MLAKKPKCVLWLDSARLQGRLGAKTSPLCVGHETQSGACRAGGQGSSSSPLLSTHGSSVCAGSNVWRREHHTASSLSSGASHPAAAVLTRPSGCFQRPPMPGSAHFNGVSVEQLISGGTGNPSTDALPKPLWREFPGVLKIQIPGPSLDWLTRSLGGAEPRGQVRGAGAGRSEVGGVGVGGAGGGRGEVGGAGAGRGEVGGAPFWPRRPVRPFLLLALQLVKG